MCHYKILKYNPKSVYMETFEKVVEVVVGTELKYANFHMTFSFKVNRESSLLFLVTCWYLGSDNMSRYK